MASPTWQDEIWNKYSELFDRDRPFASGMATLPDGWRDLVHATTNRIAQMVKTDKLGTFTIHRMSASRGVMTISWKSSAFRFEPIVTDIVDHASARSSCTCEVCGEAGVRVCRGDDIVVGCPVHRPQGGEEILPPWPMIRIDRAITGGRSVIYRSRLYDRATDRFVDVPHEKLGIRGFS